jgi:hypothetical protein
VVPEVLLTGAAELEDMEAAPTQVCFTIFKLKTNKVYNKILFYQEFI